MLQHNERQHDERIGDEQQKGDQGGLKPTLRQLAVTVRSGQG